ncbi:PPP4R2-domain-containing protein, partial [Cytidiella melzeri]
MRCQLLTPKAILTQDEAVCMKEAIYAQLDELDGAPFTIQRLCELCLHPQKEYKFLGKYFRAIKRTTLVMSTWDTFPVLNNKDSARPTAMALSIVLLLSSSAPATPMFSPIPSYMMMLDGLNPAVPHHHRYPFQQL